MLLAAKRIGASCWRGRHEAPEVASGIKENGKMVDLIASVVLAVIFIPIMIAFLLAMAWFWGAVFMGTPLTYSMLQGMWLRWRTRHDA